MAEKELRFVQVATCVCDNMDNWFVIGLTAEGRVYKLVYDQYCDAQGWRPVPMNLTK